MGQVVGGADRLRPEPGARTVRGAAVEGRPEHDDVALGVRRLVVEVAARDAEERDVGTELGAVPLAHHRSMVRGTRVRDPPPTRAGGTRSDARAQQGRQHRAGAGRAGRWTGGRDPHLGAGRGRGRRPVRVPGGRRRQGALGRRLRLLQPARGCRRRGAAPRQAAGRRAHRRPRPGRRRGPPGGRRARRHRCLARRRRDVRLALRARGGGRCPGCCARGALRARRDGRDRDGVRRGVPARR